MEYIPDYLKTGPEVETIVSPGLGSFFKGIANILLPGTPFPSGGGVDLSTILGGLGGGNSLLPTTQVPQIAGQIVRTAGPSLAKWLKYAWNLLVAGATVESVVQHIAESVPASQEQAVQIVQQAVVTRGGKKRRMNPCNPHALRRAIVRINRFDKFADATEKVLRKYARRK
jgi:hypothetical protein